ncbi:Lrp/AsnC family transcriptional regulator [Oceanobacillus halotolerans]|uniref:Lrp/AsnC family transcriptional regulator n=1 Tax=Oceanobacillus halotolerans TaxID=2663380 RepID=UPI0013DCB96C|nr:Lrp/AsnC family transcriptional regulator [Oceanobacillus halotolerans]
MGYEIDELDHGIIKNLSKDGRMSFTELASRLGVTEKTVRLRYKNLIDKDVLRVVGVANPVALGMKSEALIQLKVHAGSITSVIEELRAIKRIRYITLTTGNYQLLTQITVEDQSQITEVLHDINEIKGVTEVNSIVQLEVYKNTFEL